MPTRYELSYADVCADVGGDVCYADAAAAYASLSARLRQAIDGATSVALLANGYAELDVREPTYAQSMLNTPPVEQVTRRGRRSGRAHGRPNPALARRASAIHAATSPAHTSPTHTPPIHTLAAHSLLGWRGRVRACSRSSPSSRGSACST